MTNEIVNILKAQQAPPTATANVVAKVLGGIVLLVSAGLALMGAAAFKHGAWVLLVLGFCLIAAFLVIAIRGRDGSLVSFYAGRTARAMVGGSAPVLLLATMIVVFQVGMSGSMVIRPEAVQAKQQPKTTNDCQDEHLKRVEGIRAFSSGESMERRLHESVKTSQSCAEQALQDRMKK